MRSIRSSSLSLILAGAVACSGQSSGPAATARCGDGVIGIGEACDDGNTADADYCAPDCRAVTGACGDAIIQGNEACDDGNVMGSDYCSADCTALTGACGDGTLQDNESCDDGNTADGDGCAADCGAVTARCGDGQVQTGESCDDGNQVDDGNGCGASCQRYDVCGDGVVHMWFERCDDGNTSDGDYCSADCTTVTGRCGDAVVQDNEDCDDGDTVDDGDGCSATCAANNRCGDGVVDAAIEACDDGNQVDDGNGCSASCQRNDLCGDGVVQALYEQCDDGDAVDDGNGCSASCERNDVCGDGAVQALYEQCDEQDSVDGDGCDVNCTNTACGNGVVTAGEVCDDGNRVNGDGCSAACASEVLGSAMGYSVLPDGGWFAVYVGGGAIYGRCFAPDGTVRRTDFPIASGSSLQSLQVISAGDVGSTLVSWLYLKTGSYTSRTFASRLFDVSCDPLTDAFDWPPPPSGSYYTYDAAIDDDGNFALLWRETNVAYVTFYDATGVLIGGTHDHPVDAGKCAGNYGIQVSLNPATGDGVVTCQQHMGDPIYYRRFSRSDDGAGNVGYDFDDSAMVVIPESASNSAWYESHATIMSPSGAFAVEWKAGPKRRYEAVIYDPGASSSTHLIPGPTGEDYYGGFSSHGEYLQLYGDDFVLVDTNSKGYYWRYSQSGELLGCARSPAEGFVPLRTAGGTTTYVRMNGFIVRDAVDLTAFTGCQLPSCGDGDLDTGEECDDGNTMPFDGCDDVCAIERCGDEVVNGAETCDDGNTVSGDGCALCTLEPQPALPLLYIENTDDFDVSGDGAMITVQIDNGSVMATCHAPDRTLSRARFPVSPAEHTPSDALVVRAAQSRFSWVVWSDSGDGPIRGALLDGDCLVRATGIELLPTAGWSSFDAAVDAAGNLAVVGRREDYSVAAARASVADASVSELAGFDCFGSGSDSARVAVNPVGGGGVLTCQTGGALGYRRFAANGDWIDGDIVSVSVPSLESGASHAVGMNDNGALLITWRGTYDANLQTAPFYASFFDAAGAPVDVDTATSGLQSSLMISSRVLNDESSYGDAFDGVHRVLPMDGDDFIVGEPTTGPESGQTLSFYVYAADGQLLRTFQSARTSARGLDVRRDGRGVTYFRSDDQVYFKSGL